VIAALLFLLILLVDQLAKLYIVGHMLPAESIPVIQGIFHITYVQNPGAAFGILEYRRWFFIVAGLVLIGIFLRYYPRLRATTPWLHYGCIAMLAGAVGNMLDRVRLSYVVDCFDFRVWPVFNVADIAIVVGVGCMIYAIIFKMKD